MTSTTKKNNMSLAQMLSDISDEVHCPVCLELFTDPQALQCLHTFCKTCIRQLTDYADVSCPSCRKKTPRECIQDDFKAKKQVNRFKSLQDSNKLGQKGAECNSRVCNLCDKEPVQLYCNACWKYLCEDCHKIHLKISLCMPEDAQHLDERIRTFVANIDEIQREVRAELARLAKAKIDDVETTNKMSEQCLHKLETEKQKSMAVLNRWYKDQMDFVINVKDNKNAKISQHYSKMTKKLDHMLVHTQETKKCTETLLAVHDSLQDEVARELLLLKHQSFMPLLKLNLKNQGIQAFDTSKAIQVEGAAKSSITTTSFYGVLELLRSLHMAKVSTLSGEVHQLQIIEGQLFALFENRIEVLARDGSIIKKFNPGLSIAWDMCVVGDFLIVANYNKGLLQLTITGQLVKTLDQGNYLSVTKCDDETCIWAVKQDERYSTNLWIRKVDVYTNQEVKLQRITVRTSSIMHSAALGAKLYLCCAEDHCVYEVDTDSTEHMEPAMTVHGKQGSAFAGELNRPHAIYSDEASKSLLVTDPGNRRLQILDTRTYSWSILKTPQTDGGRTLQTSAVAVDDDNDIWMAAYSPQQLYKCTFK